MKKRIELPLVEPVYSAYHYQGSGSAIISTNPSVRYWYINQVMILKCGKAFLNGFTSPQLGVILSWWADNPYLENEFSEMKTERSRLNDTIKKLIDDGYYVYFDCIDDYFIEGKSFYRKRHFSHDGLICGYDEQEKTYCFYAYDEDWIYRKFWAPQKSFLKAKNYMFRKGIYGNICGIKPKAERVELQPDVVLFRMKQHIDSNLRKYKKNTEGDVHGIAVHDYIVMYLKKLYDGSIPYEKMDSRIFRVIWEHKKVMLERLQIMEKFLGINSRTSTAYKRVVYEADKLRIMYAAHKIKRRDHILPIICERMMFIKNTEKRLLKNFVKKAERALGR